LGRDRVGLFLRASARCVSAVYYFLVFGILVDRLKRSELPWQDRGFAALFALLAGGVAVLCLASAILLAALVWRRQAGLPPSPARDLPTATESATAGPPEAQGQGYAATPSSVEGSAGSAEGTMVPAETSLSPPAPSATAPAVPTLALGGGWDRPAYGKIVYACFMTPPFDEICLMNADGTGGIRLTDNEAEDFYPSLAPDGSAIVFSSRMEGRFEIYNMNLDGSEQRRLTREIGSGLYAPAVSPDGSSIVFTNNMDGFQSIWFMGRYGNDPRPLTDPIADDVDPIWSPDGRSISFASTRAGSRQIYLMDADGGNLRRLTQLPDMGGRTSWSPDGRLLAFYAGPTGDRNIYVIDIGQGLVWQLTYGGDGAGPCFSPDGQWIAFAAYYDGDLEVFIMRPDGSELTQLTFNSFSDWQPRWGP